jgi:hypothetical protein
MIIHISIILQGFVTLLFILCCQMQSYLSCWYVADAGANWSTLSPCSQQTDFVTAFCWLECLQTPSLPFPWVLFGLAAIIQVLGQLASACDFGPLVHTLQIRQIHAGIQYEESTCNA